MELFLTGRNVGDVVQVWVSSSTYVYRLPCNLMTTRFNDRGVSWSPQRKEMGFIYDIGYHSFSTRVRTSVLGNRKKTKILWYLSCMGQGYDYPRVNLRRSTTIDFEIWDYLDGPFTYQFK